MKVELQKGSNDYNSYVEKIENERIKWELMTKEEQAKFLRDAVEGARLTWKAITDAYPNISVNDLQAEIYRRKYNFQTLLKCLDDLPSDRRRMRLLIEVKAAYDRDYESIKSVASANRLDGSPSGNGDLLKFGKDLEIEIKKYEKLLILNENFQTNSGTKKNTDLTLDRATLFLNFLFRFANVNCPNTKKAKVISFLTGYSENTVGDKLSALYSKEGNNFVQFVKDMKIVRRYFENLGLSQITEMIDRDLKM